jgi:hypothetical protein
MRHFTKVQRFEGCGKWLNGAAEGTVIVKKSADGIAGLSGLQRCGSVWSCPACAARIRQHRGDELEATVASWIARGGGIEFVTLTLDHGLGDELETLFTTVSEGWRQGVISGRSWAGCEDGCTVEHRKGDCLGTKRRYGIAAWHRTVEVTHGANGWHPHLHVLLFTDRPLTGRRRALLGARIFARWAVWAAKKGHRVSRAAFKIVPGAKGAGAYVTKLQDGRGLASEFTRADMKQGRNGSRAPFELIEPAFDGEADALRLWWEWEASTAGRRCMTWSVGGRDAVGLPEVEVTDQEIVDEDQGGEVVLVLTAVAWRAVAAVPAGDARLLASVERGDGARYLGQLLRAGP